MENVMEVTELEPNRKVALKLVRAPWGGTGRTWYTFTPVDGGTRVDWTWEMEPAGLWKPLGSRPLMGLFGRRFQRDLDNLKVMMESGQL
jgi:carbon monoxide dehydrogenase subunit G